MLKALQNGVAAGVILAVFTACDEPQIRSYRVAKENRDFSLPPQHAHEHEAPARRARPKVAYTTPNGWKEMASDDINLAAFVISGTDGKDARVSVAALPLMQGREADIVNLWRGSLKMSPLEPDKAREQLQDVSINDEKGKLFELSTTEDAKLQKILTVMVHRPGASWFYKLQGDAAIVDVQKNAFMDFIKSVRVEEAVEEAPSGAPDFSKAAPSDWKALPPGNMQVAKFAIPTVQGATGQVSVSVFDSDTGGTLANVNRWRRQIGLSEIEGEQLRQFVTPLDSANSRAVLVSMTNDTQQLVGAIVPRGSQWFFYKLVGNPSAVAPQQEAFAKFAARSH